MPRNALTRFCRTLLYWPFQNSRAIAALSRDNPVGTTVRFSLLHRRRKVELFRVRLHGVEVWLRSGTPDVYVAGESLGGEFDPAIALLPSDSEGLIIDGGGYIGTAAIKLARAFPRARIVTIEPSSSNLEMLRRNVAGIPNIEVLHAALAAAEGTVTLRDMGVGAWGYSIVTGGGVKPEAPTLETVPTVTVGGLLSRSGVDRLLLLKLDVEGAEGEILAASAGWMARAEIVIAELHEGLVPDIEAIYARAVAGRDNRHLPGEKAISLRAVAR